MHREVNLLGRVISDLNNEQDSVSDGALVRNGALLEHSWGRIYVTILGEEQSTENSKVSRAPSRCRVCKGNAPTSPTDSFKRAPYRGFDRVPLQKPNRYYIPDPETHRIVGCNSCYGLGKHSCLACDGRGYDECSSCRGKGYEYVKDKCEVCNREHDNCQACGGDGYIKYKQSCSNCDGPGVTKCDDCFGEGVVRCHSCHGDGELHKCDVTKVKIDPEAFICGLDESWSEENMTVAQRLDLPQANFKKEGDRYRIVTEPAYVQFFRIGYGDDTHRVLVVENGENPKVFWDPETSYPETSYRRKLGDLKSRIF